ncbi:TetR/AcrR family transcriptional regulator [Kineosporia sp. NBRC 101731]|uniref:TetR/AcrR family transcriptional regulator n=1 Tax=Kineosporia sp. NBRC 101731 TaxID=3032199 RepID=UPI0024A2443F|nr:TetR/AcrR family transcriptional regulator [Kineosporia sp. NBRC 101731]GLY31570.1 TetR family transcriptional regulator [Kineosporia sp. NBRC 101731]
MPRAGLDAGSVTAAGAALADEVGFDRLSMGLLAERLGVKAPSLYKHVTGQADLSHRIAVLAMTEIADTIGEATRGRAGRDALVAGANAMRTYALKHPGRYTAGNVARPNGAEDPLHPAVDRLLASWTAMLRGYRLDPDQEIHVLRLLRSILHGFAILEATGGFRIGIDVDDSFTWMVRFIDQGLRTTTP